MRRVIVMGAGGRDFHDFATVYRDDPSTEVVAFTAAQIPGIDDRVFPASLAGPRYPDGIPIRPEDQLERLAAEGDVDEVVLAYSDLSHEDVMHLASRVLATGADFRLLGMRATALSSTRPVIAVGAVRTGCGKSQTSRRIGRLLLDAGRRVALIRHPMPYGDLETMRVQRFASLADIDAADPVETVLANVQRLCPEATVVRAESPVTLDDGPDLDGSRVLVVEDGPTHTHGGMPFGAGTVAARAAGAEIVDVVPAMGYGPDQVAELASTVAATDCDAVIAGTPIDLARLLDVPQPVRRARYELREMGTPTLADVLAAFLDRAE